MVVMDYDSSSGKLSYKGQSVSTLPAGYAGTNFPSGIQVSRDGRFLYGANRLCDSIVIFDIDPDGWIRIHATNGLGAAILAISRWIPRAHLCMSVIRKATTLRRFE